MKVINISQILVFENTVQTELQKGQNYTTSKICHIF